MSPLPALYDYDAASALVGLAPVTIGHYCDRGHLERGRDFTIISYRYGRRRRRVRFITRAGIQRLLDRAYTTTARNTHTA